MTVPPELQAEFEEIKGMENGYVIIGGPEFKLFGNLRPPSTLCVWSNRENAEVFLADTAFLDDDKVYEKTMDEILEIGRKHSFASLTFNFSYKRRPPFICCALEAFLKLTREQGQ